MKILAKFIYIIILFHATLSLSAQLDTLYYEDFTDQEYPYWEISNPGTQKLNLNHGLGFENSESNSIDILTSPTLNLSIYDSLILVSKDLFEVSNEDSLMLSISEDGGDTYNIHFDLKTLVSDTINLSDTLSSFNNIILKYTIAFKGNSKNQQFWSIQSCQILGRTIIGGVAKVSTETGDNDKERFYYECLSVGEEVNLSLVLTNEFDYQITIESLDIFVTAVNHIDWNSSIIPVEIISAHNDIINQITGIHNQNVSLNQGEKAHFNIPLTIKGPESTMPYIDLSFVFKITEDPYNIMGSLTTKIGNCCQKEMYTVNNHNEPLPYFLKTNSHIEINNMRPLDVNEKSILTAVDYILLEPKDTMQFVSIFNQRPNSTDIFIAKMSIDTCIVQAPTPPTPPTPPIENDTLKVGNKTKFENATVSMYPNPTTGTLNFNITSETEDEFINIEIINTVGNIVLKKKMSNNNSNFFEINTSLLLNGLYYAKIYTSKFVTTKKFYKQ